MQAYVSQIAVGLAGLAASWFLASLVRRYAIGLRLVQAPNERSSHTIPTPSGAGVSIAIVGTISGMWVGTGQTTLYLWLAVVCSAVIAVIGLIDDRFELSSRLRLLLHCALVGVLLNAVGPLPPIATPVGVLLPAATIAALAFCGVWWINLFNFMDGIDGIASSEAIFVVLGSLAIGAITNELGESAPVASWALLVVAATAGFMVMNWPPAKVFMGDAGSNYLAVSILSLMLALIAAGTLSYAAATILCATFVADASLTLMVRMSSRQSWRQAHRDHVYQKLSRKWQSHRNVTLSYIATNVLWLFPLALCAQMNQLWGWGIAFLAYLPLLAVCIATKAGKPDTTP